MNPVQIQTAPDEFELMWEDPETEELYTAQQLQEEIELWDEGWKNQ